MKATLTGLAVFFTAHVFATPLQAAQTSLLQTDGSNATRTEAYVRSTNAQQGLLVRQTGKGDEACFGTVGMSEILLKTDVQLLHADPGDLARLAQTGPVGGPGNATDIFIEAIRRRLSGSGVPAENLKSIASLHQMVLEIDRDGDDLQFLFKKYRDLKLPISIAELGFKTDEDSLIQLANELSPKTCSSPYDTSSAAWHIALRKIANWGAKYDGTRDTAVLAGELLALPQLSPVLESLKKAPFKKIMVLGHSYTMEQHWATPSAFVPIVAEMLKRIHSPVQISQITQGGLNAAWALNSFVPKVIAAHPDTAYIVVTTTTADDVTAFGQILSRIKIAGIEPVVFDAIDPYDPYDHNPVHAQAALAVARAQGVRIVALQAQYDQETGGNRLRDISLDGVHMTEAYHRAMAVGWLPQLLP